MKRLGQVVAVIVLLAAAVAVVAARRDRKDGAAEDGRRAGVAVSAEIVRVPRLVDLGAGRCIPCKAMAPLLEELRAEYAGRLEVQFIDVWKDPDAAKPFGIDMIPTQIFFSADGRELARHVGFMSKEEILAQWRAAGVSL
ncbi:thioredoxin family protein [Anaeromyxobacter terrae]|uniref:thioredoxin family protein n=1 Tax=Anaeromyxobacter terrae TaxID=2925406 RepID=UPI001F561A41|nr:thioredoxin family protein [Anaeromyxobacter sp. SG22]